MRRMPLRLSLALVFFCVCLAGTAGARPLQVNTRPLEVKIIVVSPSPARVHIEGRRGVGATAWSFRNFYGSIAQR